MDIHTALLMHSEGDIQNFLASCDSKNVNQLDGEGRSPLHIASDQDLSEVVKVLLKKKAKINLRDKHGWTPLHCAANSAAFEVCSLLIAAKADLMATTDNNNSVFSYLVKGKSPDPFQLSLVDTHMTKELVNKPNIHNETVFSRACLLGSEEILRLLLERNGDISYKGAHQNSPLHYAVRSGQEAIVKILLDAQADPLAENDEGNTVIQEARDIGRNNLATLLEMSLPRSLTTSIPSTNLLNELSHVILRNEEKTKPVNIPIPHTRDSPTPNTQRSFQNHPSSLPSGNSNRRGAPLPSNSLGSGNSNRRGVPLPSNSPGRPLVRRGRPMSPHNATPPGRGTQRYYPSRENIRAVRGRGRGTLRGNGRGNRRGTFIPHRGSTFRRSRSLSPNRERSKTEMGANRRPLPCINVTANSTSKNFNLTSKGKSMVVETSEKRSLLERVSLEPIPVVEPEHFFRLTLPPERPPTEDLEKKLIPAWHTFEEICTTESLYVHQLDMVITSYKKPLESTYSRFASAEQVALIFSSIEDIFSLSYELLNILLKEREKPPAERKIGKCFLTLIPKFSVYTPYCTNQCFSQDTLCHLIENNKKFESFLSSTQANDPSKQDLFGYLIKPFQRVCRYVLLLRELVKHTPESWDDYILLKKSIEGIDIVVRDANETKRVMDNELKIQAISQSLDIEMDKTRAVKFICEGEVKVFSIGHSRKPLPRHFYLFNKLLLITKVLSKAKHQVKHSIPVENCILWDQPDDPHKHLFAFQIVRTDATDKITLLCPTVVCKENWMNEINTCISSSGAFLW